MNRCFYSFVTCLAAFVLSTSAGNAQEPTATASAGSEIAIKFDGELFTKVCFDGYRRPILYPVYGPGQIPMTRNYPMKKDVEGEATDHPHHKSIWCGHGLINGVSFWHEEGRIVVDKTKPFEISANDDKSIAVTFHANYLGPNDELVCTDENHIAFRQLEDNLRVIDWDITIHASEGDLLFGDTKEGMMAIRTHPKLRIDKGAKARNSEGIQGEDIWGKHAEWVAYSGNVDGEDVVMAIFDHPQNLRHPTTWHARAYGLVAANPFGLSNFEGKPKGTGDFKVNDGDSLRFRYRFVFHKGAAGDTKLAELYKNYSENASKH